jgi:hypothetical protein
MDGIRLYAEDRCTFGSTGQRGWTTWQRTDLEDTGNAILLSFNALKCLVTGVILLLEELDDS